MCAGFSSFLFLLCFCFFFLFGFCVLLQINSKAIYKYKKLLCGLTQNVASHSQVFDIFEIQIILISNQIGVILISKALFGFL